MKALHILNLKIVEQVLNLENREKLYKAIQELELIENIKTNILLEYDLETNFNGYPFEGIAYDLADEVEDYFTDEDLTNIYEVTVDYKKVSFEKFNSVKNEILENIKNENYYFIYNNEKYGFIE